MSLIYSIERNGSECSMSVGTFRYTSGFELMIFAYRVLVRVLFPYKL